MAQHRVPTAPRGPLWPTGGPSGPQPGCSSASRDGTTTARPRQSRHRRQPRRERSAVPPWPGATRRGPCHALPRRQGRCLLGGSPQQSKAASSESRSPAQKKVVAMARSRTDGVASTARRKVRWSASSRARGATAGQMLPIDLRSDGRQGPVEVVDADQCLVHRRRRPPLDRLDVALLVAHGPVTDLRVRESVWPVLGVGEPSDEATDWTR